MATKTIYIEETALLHSDGKKKHGVITPTNNWYNIKKIDLNDYIKGIKKQGYAVKIVSRERLIKLFNMRKN